MTNPVSGDDVVLSGWRKAGIHFGILIFGLSFSSLASAQSGTINTVAGGGNSVFGTGVAANTVSLAQPGGVFVDGSGNIFIADTGNNMVREVSPGGTITTVAGPGGMNLQPPLLQPTGVFVDGNGNLFIADSGNGLIREISAAGVASIVAGGGLLGFSGDMGLATVAEMYQPTSMAVDANGNIFIADTLNNRIREVMASSGNINTVAGNGFQGFSGDGGAATSAMLNYPTGVVVDGSGNLYIADQYNNRIRMVSSSGTITTIAGSGVEGFSGDGGKATAAELYNPSSVFLDAAGNLYIAVAYSNRIRKVSPSGIITTVAGNGTQFFSGDGGSATSATLNHPAGVALDSSGNIYIADTGNNRIREVTAPPPPPTISAGGIVPLDSPVTTIQPGEWASIYGTNLAAGVANWTGQFPTILGGTRVTIDGNAAYLSYVSPGLINLQVPDDTNTGRPVTVVVTTQGGTTSGTVTLAQFAPSFALLGDGTHVAAIIPRSNGKGTSGGGTYDIVGPTGNSLGYPTVAAKAGDVVELFAVGLGPTNPAVPAGEAYSAATEPLAPTTNTVTVTINNVPVNPSFAGLSAAGLFQVNVTIPAGLGKGDVPLVASVGGSQTQANVVIAVQ